MRLLTQDNPPELATAKISFNHRSSHLTRARRYPRDSRVTARGSERHPQQRHGRLGEFSAARSAAFAIVESGSTVFAVQELFDRTGSYEFDYCVSGVRRGYEGYQPVVTRGSSPAEASCRGGNHACHEPSTGTRLAGGLSNTPPEHLLTCVLITDTRPAIYSRFSETMVAREIEQQEMRCPRQTRFWPRFRWEWCRSGSP